MPEVQLPQGTIQYREDGSGPPVLLVHGLLVNGRVWDPLVSALRSHARCIVPDLPLGSHRLPMRQDADLSPLGLAQLIGDLIARLELEDVTVIGNDTGGALSQLLVAHRPERVARLVLINCDAFENFPPPALRLLMRGLARIPGALAALGTLGRARVMRRATMSLAPLTVEPIADDLLKEWIAPLRDPRIRHDVRRFMGAIDPKDTLEAAERLRNFDRPALIAWGVRDAFFPVRDAERLVETLPNARLERIENARTFVQLDAPDRLAELVAEFVAARVGVAAA